MKSLPGAFHSELVLPLQTPFRVLPLRRVCLYAFGPEYTCIKSLLLKYCLIVLVMIHDLALTTTRISYRGPEVLPIPTQLLHVVVRSFPYHQIQPIAIQPYASISSIVY